jgi:hypothetical protein
LKADVASKEFFLPDIRRAAAAAAAPAASSEPEPEPAAAAEPAASSAADTSQPGAALGERTAASAPFPNPPPLRPDDVSSSPTASAASALKPLLLRLGGDQCAACWRSLRALMGDACMGLTRLKSAGGAQAFRMPQRSGMFLERAIVQEALDARSPEADAAAQAVECNDHAAAKSAASAVGKRKAYYDRTGVAVMACRHEQVGCISLLPPQP